MSMMWDHKKAVQTIMQRRKAGGGEIIAGPAPMKPEVVKDEDGEMEPRHVAAQDIMAAMHEKSPERLMGALSNFVDIHMNRKDEPEPEE